jgi:hypothetical protein
MYPIRRFVLPTMALSLVAVAGACAPVMRGAPIAAPASDPSGTWQVRFESAQVRVGALLELRTAGSALHATVLGPEAEWLRISDISHRAGRIELIAGTPQGDMKMNAVTDADRLQGTWAADHPIGRFLMRGEVSGHRVDPGTRASLLPGGAVVDSTAALIATRYFDPSFNGADWPRVRREHASRAATARTDGEVVDVIRSMLGVLDASHLGFSAARLQTDDATATAAPVVTWRQQSPSAGYVKIAAFPVGADAVPAMAALDSAFAALEHVPSLVIDLRGNPGGGLDLAAHLADHLLAEARPAGLFVTRHGLVSRGLHSISEIDAAAVPHRLPRHLSAEGDFADQLDAEGGAVMIVAGGGRRNAYSGRVVVLIDGSTHSAAEAVAASLRESGRATLVGDRTAGAMLSGIPHPIARGWELRIPVADFRTPLGQRVEGVGVEPDVSAGAVRGSDAPLDRALQVLSR